MSDAIIGPENWTIWRPHYARVALWHRVRASRSGDAGGGARYSECDLRLYASGFRRRAGGVCATCYAGWTRTAGWTHTQSWSPLEHVFRGPHRFREWEPDKAADGG